MHQLADAEVTSLVFVTRRRDALQKDDSTSATSPTAVSELVPGSFPTLFVAIRLQDSTGQQDNQYLV